MKGAILNLPHFSTINLSDYIYIRPQDDCYVCGTSTFKVYTTLDIASLEIESSVNIETEIVPISQNSFHVIVTSLIGNSEGSQGYFDIIDMGVGVGVFKSRQNLWVGKPQTLPDGLLFGTGDNNIPILPGTPVSHTLGGLQYRFGGFDYMNWEYPNPNEPVYSSLPSNPEVWNYIEYNKFFNIESSNSGSTTGWVRVSGINPCGVGEGGEINEICVKNTGDGAPDCEPDPIAIIYYPNPADSILEVDLSLQEFGTFDIVIYDQSQTIEYSGESSNIVKSIDTFNLENGTYYLHVYNDGGVLLLSSILIINH